MLLIIWDELMYFYPTVIWTPWQKLYPLKHISKCESVCHQVVFLLTLINVQYGIPFYLQYLAHWPEYFIVAEAPGGELMGYSESNLSLSDRYHIVIYSPVCGSKSLWLISSVEYRKMFYFWNLCWKWMLHTRMYPAQ